MLADILANLICGRSRVALMPLSEIILLALRDGSEVPLQDIAGDLLEPRFWPMRVTTTASCF
jgi:hypothetical protein